MATQTLTYTSTNKLSCAGCQPADIFLCLNNPALIAQSECPITEDPTNFQYNTIPAMLFSTRQFKNCGQTYYEYTISYDDALLVPDTNLVCTDISGIVCDGCLITLVRDIAGQEVTVTTDEIGNQVLVSQHGCEYPINATGYVWTFTGDTGSTETVNSTNNVEYLGGTSISTVSSIGDQLTINLDLSTDPDQLLGLDGSNNILLTCDDLTGCPLFTIQGDGGLQQTISVGDSLTIEGDSVTTVTLSAPDIVTINTPVGAGFSIPVIADAGTAETIVQGESLSILGSGEVTTTTSAVNVVTIGMPSYDALVGEDRLDIGGVIANVTAVGDYTTTSLGPIIINNPSLDRPLELFYCINHSAQISLGQDWDGSLSGETEVNGGGFSTFDFDLRIGPINPITDHFNSWFYSYQDVQTIAAGGSVTLEFRPRIYSYIGGAGNTSWASHFYNFVFIGATSN